MRRIPVIPCPVCGKNMPEWRRKEGGCKPCVALHGSAIVDALAQAARERATLFISELERRP